LGNGSTVGFGNDTCFYFDRNSTSAGYQQPGTKDVYLNAAILDNSVSDLIIHRNLTEIQARELAIVRTYIHELWHVDSSFGDLHSGFELQYPGDNMIEIKYRALNEAVTEFLTQYAYDHYTYTRYGFIESDQNIGYTTYSRLVREMFYAVSDYYYKSNKSKKHPNEYFLNYWRVVISVYMESDPVKKVALMSDFDNLFGGDFLQVLSIIGISKNLPSDTTEESVLKLLTQIIEGFRSEHGLGTRKSFSA
jgi:hypothetical protein